MRNRTAIVLGAVLAGTLVTGVGTTTAVFSDSGSSSVTVGAARVSLAVATSPTDLVLTPPDGTGTVVVTNTGSTAATLHLSAVDGAGAPLTTCPKVPKVTITVPPQGVPAPAVPLCSAIADGGELLDLPAGATTTITVQATGYGQRWTGGLGFTLAQDGGGFSDSAHVAVRVSPQ
jgi:hypothetical protein